MAAEVEGAEHSRVRVNLAPSPKPDAGNPGPAGSGAGRGPKVAGGPGAAGGPRAAGRPKVANGPAVAGPGPPARSPAGPRSSGPVPPGPRPPGHRRRRRRWPRRLLIGTNIFLLVCLAGAGAAYAYVHYRLAQIKRVSVHGTTAAAPSQPQNFLLVGSDSRVGENAKQFGSTTQVAGQRSDVIILVHLDPATGKAAMLSIPRDTYVPIAGTGSSAKINVAFDTGSPDRLIQTIHQDFGIPIHHYMAVNFGGLEGLTNTVGGVCMHFPYPVRDGSPSGYGNESGLKEPAGNDHLNGAQALSLVRSRYYQYYANGQWNAEGTGDLGRIIRQHEFLRALASKAISAGIHNPVTANALVTQAVNDVTVDNGLSTSDILRLISEFHSLHPSQVPSWTLPTTASTNQAGDVLVPDPNRDAKLIATWANYGVPSSAPSGPPQPSSSSSTTAVTLAPSAVSVEVLNGSGAPGQAGQAAQGLTAAGFQVVNYGDASSFASTTSTVAYGPGMQAAAQTVADQVQGGASISEDPSMTGSTVILTTGSSFTGIGPAQPGAAGASGSTSTTSTTTGSGSGTASLAASGQAKPPAWDPTPC